MNVLLTGASGSLGKEFISQFEKRNINYIAHVNNNSISEKSYVCDFSKSKNLEIFKDIIKNNNITCLINNAGKYFNSELNYCSDDSIIDTININLVAPILLCKYLYAHLLHTNQVGKIININSLAGKQPNYLESVYCASKFGLSGFGSSLSINQKKSKIQIIDCYIGGMKSNITKERNNYNNLMDPVEISSFIVDLIQNNNQYNVSSIDLRNII